jgi:hypothetical protein
MATGENPPDGAMIDYTVGLNFTGVLTLEILDAAGNLVCRYNSNDPVPPLDPRYPDPTLWARPPRILSAAPGHHRFLWDMRYPAVPGMSTGPDADEAVPYDTPAVPSSPWVMPGTYSVRLIAGNTTLAEPLQIKMDPRVKTSAADIESQFKVSQSIYADTLKATAAIHEIAVLREQLKARSSQAPVAAAGDSIEAKLQRLAGGEGRGGRGGAAGPPTLNSLRLQLARIEHSIQNADMAPTAAQVEAYASLGKPMQDLLDQWNTIKASDLKTLNNFLQARHLPLLALDTSIIDHNVYDQIELGDDQ